MQASQTVSQPDVFFFTNWNVQLIFAHFHKNSSISHYIFYTLWETDSSREKMKKSSELHLCLDKRAAHKTKPPSRGTTSTKRKKPGAGNSIIRNSGRRTVRHVRRIRRETSRAEHWIEQTRGGVQSKRTPFLSPLAPSSRRRVSCVPRVRCRTYYTTWLAGGAPISAER